MKFRTSTAAAASGGDRPEVHADMADGRSRRRFAGALLCSGRNRVDSRPHAELGGPSLGGIVEDRKPMEDLKKILGRAAAGRLRSVATGLFAVSKCGEPLAVLAVLPEKIFAIERL